MGNESLQRRTGTKVETGVPGLYSTENLLTEFPIEKYNFSFYDSKVPVSLTKGYSLSARELYKLAYEGGAVSVAPSVRTKEHLQLLINGVQESALRAQEEGSEPQIFSFFVDAWPKTYPEGHKIFGRDVDVSGQVINDSDRMNVTHTKTLLDGVFTPDKK